ncbi:MAG: hypothetical protein ACE5EQ_05045 [Phycisphaerae bacterium]
MPITRRFRSVSCVALLSACLGMTCDISGLDSILGGLTGNQVSVEVTNETAFIAVPDIRTGKSRNFIEDFIAGSGDPLTNFGTFGTVPASDTITFTLPCNGDIETVIYEGVTVRDVNGFPLGKANANKVLHRDFDFDCGDKIHITISGGVFNFKTAIGVERAEGSTRFGSIDTGSNSLDDDIANLLDNLFN